MDQQSSGSVCVCFRSLIYQLSTSQSNIFKKFSSLTFGILIIQYKLCLQAVDRDGSGEISIEEFKMFYACLGLSEEVSCFIA